MNKKIVIIGAGPTGLGAAWRLSELKHQNWHLYERHAYPGGLASSFADKNGFTWDIGGHVLFSHYKYFDRLMDKLLGKSWYYHVRESWIWIFDRFVPYPFQYNIKHLPPDELWKCIKGLIDRQNSPPQKRPKNFAEWIYQGFGQGLAEIFMIPYNFKVWAHHPRLMHYKWIGERVATIDLDRLIKNITDDLDDISWGPNSTFRFPKNNGTGQIFSSLARRLNQEKISYQKDVGKIDVKKKDRLFYRQHQR
ncbi:MAG: NAD(P)-binding protein [Patescibacteria group bacterium]